MLSHKKLAVLNKGRFRCLLSNKILMDEPIY